MLAIYASLPVGPGSGGAGRLVARRCFRQQGAVGVAVVEVACVPSGGGAVAVGCVVVEGPRPLLSPYLERLGKPTLVSEQPEVALLGCGRATLSAGLGRRSE